MMHELFEGLFTEDDKDFLDWVLKSLATVTMPD
jgi:hypothetical protein